jgi:hypothetical protein
LIGFTGDGGRAGVAAFEEGLTGLQRKAAFVFALGVTVDAGCLEEGFDLLAEVDLVRGGSWERFGSIGTGRGGGAQLADENRQPS